MPPLNCVFGGARVLRITCAFLTNELNCGIFGLVCGGSGLQVK